MEKVSEIRQCYFEANLDNPVGLELFSSNILRYDLRKQKELTEHFLAKWPNDGFVAKHKVQMLLSYSPSFNAPVGQTLTH